MRFLFGTLICGLLVAQQQSTPQHYCSKPSQAVKSRIGNHHNSRNITKAST